MWQVGGCGEHELIGRHALDNSPYSNLHHFVVAEEAITGDSWTRKSTRPGAQVPLLRMPRYQDDLLVVFFAFHFTLSWEHS